jgi:tRNA modification GTPase
MDPPALFRVVLLTPPGRGAVATVRVEGRGACQQVDTLFEAVSQRPVADLASDRLAFGRFRLGDQVYDEVIVRRPADEAVEIHCHGGPAVVERLITVLTEAGGRRVATDEWLQSSHASPIVAAAHAALGNATTLRAAAILLDQYHGALDRSLEAILRNLKGGRVDAATDEIRQLLARAPCGCHLARPWPIVLAGRPNVGKSSLINALVGYRRAIVHKTPGTTRDLVTATTALDGWPVEFCDTAGLRAADHAIEQEGIGLAKRELESASLVLLVFDAAEPWCDEDAELCSRYPDALLVFNKIDLDEVILDGRPGGQLVSAAQGQGVDELIAAIVGRLVPHPPTPAQAVPFLDEQRHVLQMAADALGLGDIHAGIAQIVQLLQ